MPEIGKHGGCNLQIRVSRNRWYHRNWFRVCERVQCTHNNDKPSFALIYFFSFVPEWSVYMNNSSTPRWPQVKLKGTFSRLVQFSTQTLVSVRLVVIAKFFQTPVFDLVYISETRVWAKDRLSMDRFLILTIIHLRYGRYPSCMDEDNSIQI